jgi:hypothetical protein
VPIKSKTAADVRTGDIHRRAPLKPPQAPYRSLAPARATAGQKTAAQKIAPRKMETVEPPSSARRSRDTSPSFHPRRNAKDNSEANNWFLQSSSKCFVPTSASNFPSAKSLSLLKFVDDAVTCRCNDLRPVTASGPAGVDSIWATLRWSCGRPEQFG